MDKAGRAYGVGSGGLTGFGEDNFYYKNGIGIFIELRNEIKNSRRYCERCHKDLIDATRGQWCVHHKDYDRANNQISNFELLCKRCHQIEHNCIANLPNATTIPEGSRIQVDSKRMAPRTGDEIV